VQRRGASTSERWGQSDGIARVTLALRRRLDRGAPEANATTDVNALFASRGRVHEGCVELARMPETEMKPPIFDRERKRPAAFFS